jgi:hypothetical protein
VLGRGLNTASALLHPSGENWRYAEQVKLCSSWLLIPFALLSLRSTAHAITIRVSPEALERTLERQLFREPQGRYFIRGHSEAGCFAYAEDPKVSFRDERVVVHVRTRSRLGTSMRGACIGIGLNVEADVTLVPEAQGETIGFHDPRIENLSESKELNLFLEPFLSRKLPQQMRLNAADLLRQALASSKESTGYDLRLSALKIHSMQVSNNSLVLDVDGDLEVH